MVLSLNQIQTFHRIHKLQFISKISRVYLTFFTLMLKSMSFSLTVPNRASNMRKDFSLPSPEFFSCIQPESEKDWPVDFAKL